MKTFIAVKSYLCKSILAKQRVISSFLLCAFAIIFAHSIIPHHHHEGNGVASFTIPDDNDGFLGHAFSFFQHDKGSAIIYEGSSPTYQTQKISFYTDVLPLVQCFVRRLYEPPLIHADYYSNSFTLSSYPLTSLFRGPPVLVG